MLDLIRERMEKAKAEGSTKTGFLIDGYPRELDQGILFEKNVSVSVKSFGINCIVTSVYTHITGNYLKFHFFRLKTCTSGRKIVHRIVSFSSMFVVFRWFRRHWRLVAGLIYT